MNYIAVQQINLLYYLYTSHNIYEYLICHFFSCLLRRLSIRRDELYCCHSGMSDNIGEYFIVFFRTSLGLGIQFTGMARRILCAHKMR